MTTEKGVPIFSRRRFLQLSLLGTVAASGGALLAACGGTTATPTIAPAPASAPPSAAASAPTTAAAATTQATAPATRAASSPVAAGTATRSAAGTPGGASTPVAAIDGKYPSGNPLVPDAYTKLPPPFKSSTGSPLSGGKVSVFMIAYNPPPTPKAQNNYWQELEKRLGVQLDITFVPQAAYVERLAAATAAGDLPDLVYVNTGMAPDQFKALLQGAYTDLTPLLTGDSLKTFPNLAAFPQKLWENVAINKKILGVPRMRYFANNPLFFRQDWAEKVGIPHPKNAEELFNLFLALTKNDPDGNGRGDSFALTGMGGDVFSLGWFNNMFRVPNGWRLNPDKTLTNQLETEEFRNTITYIRRLWEAGVYHPDSAQMNLQQARDAFIAGKIGGYSSGFLELPGSQGLRAKTKAASSPNADVQAILPPGHDGGKPSWRLGGGIFGFVSVNNKVGRDQARARDLLRVLDWFAAPFGSEEYNFLNFGILGTHYTIGTDGSVVRTDSGRAEIAEIPLIANSPPAFFYPDTPADGPYMQGVMRSMVDVGVNSPVESLYAPSASEKAAVLNQLTKDRTIDIVVGRRPLSGLDELISEWRSRGGDQIRKEYQDALNQ